MPLPPLNGASCIRPAAGLQLIKRLCSVQEPSIGALSVLLVPEWIKFLRRMTSTCLVLYCWLPTTKNRYSLNLLEASPIPSLTPLMRGQSAPQAIAAHLGFNGELCERKIGWYLLGNGYRAYNPTLMRFHSPDSWSPFRKGGVNAYMYCAGDPRSFTDPTGHMRSPGFLRASRARSPSPTRVVLPRSTAMANEQLPLTTSTSGIQTLSTNTAPQSPTQNRATWAVISAYSIRTNRTATSP